MKRCLIGLPVTLPAASIRLLLSRAIRFANVAARRFEALVACANRGTVSQAGKGKLIVREL
jgi:hypothetical protein